MASRSVEFYYEPLGVVHLSMRTNSRSFTARWKKGKVYLGVPFGANHENIMRALEQFTPALLKNKPQLAFFDGQQITFHDFSINIKRQSVLPAKILSKAQLPISTIEVGTDWDFEDDKTTQAISRLMCGISRRLAPQLLLPRAEQLAGQLNVKPSGWSISSGHRVLGHCDNRRHIALSHIILYLPQHLRDYIVYHELAHLSEMNHSPRFHALCDQYCQGNEALYIKQLRQYPWPLLK